VGVLGASTVLAVFFGMGISSAWLSVLLWLMFGFSVFLFVVPGHGLIYGPHLWLLAIVDIFRCLFRRK